MKLRTIITTYGAALLLLACSDDNGPAPPDWGDLGYGTSLFTATKGTDYESPALDLAGYAGEITVRVKDVRNFSTKQSEPLFLAACEVPRWSSPVNPETDKSLQAVLAKYSPLQESTLSADPATGKLTLHGAGSGKIPAGVYLVDLEITRNGTTDVKEGICRLQLKENAKNAVEATIGWRVSTSTDNVSSPATSRELTGDNLEAFKQALGPRYDAQSGYLVLKLQDRRRQPIGFGDRLVPRNAALNTFEKANPWAEIIYTPEAIIIPYPVPLFPVATQADNSAHYRIAAANNAFNQDIFVDCFLAVRQKGVFEIACTLADSDVQGKLTVIPGGKKIYKPRQDGIQNIDFYNENSAWSYHRMASSENIVVFWEPGFGDDPNAASLPSDLRFDVHDLLAKGEQFYAFYRDSLRFIEPGESRTDSLKMIVRALYQTDWAAYGGGYDYVIGALWVNPATMHPVGQTIAHEFGHTFQYQVYCDGKYGYNNTSIGPNPGAVGFFWEICAQYMSWQLYPDLTSQVGDFIAKSNMGFAHEWTRYQAFYLVEYWRVLHGLDFLSRVWREATYGEDPVETYKKVTGVTQAKFNDEVWESACHNLTWDYPQGHAYRQVIDASTAASKAKWYTHKTKLLAEPDGYWIVAPDIIATTDPGTSLIDQGTLAPHDYGYNAIPLNVPSVGTTVSVDFKGVRGDTRYRTSDDARAGWRYGFVGVKSDGWTPVYGPIYRDDEGNASFTVTETLSRLWLVVSGAPTTHDPHVWDDNTANDEEYPYKVKFSNTTYKQ
ncbi:MAG: DUF6055 domain-containing protein [Odoribacteraceae bacterium]|jgi:hypothetical protein|nr:DUF6055 domain-containing protein [Odoribacteraceae bacterium]